MMREALIALGIGGGLLVFSSVRSKGVSKTKKIDPEKMIRKVWDEDKGALKPNAKSQVEDFLEDRIEEDDADALGPDPLVKSAAQDLVPMYPWDDTLSPMAQEVLRSIRALVEEALA